MTRFLGTHVFKLDAKGRLSIPARFRAILDRAGSDELVLRPSHLLPCVECYPTAAFEALSEGLDKLDVFAEDTDDLAAVLFAQAQNVRPDSEGRLVLPKSCAIHAGLKDEVALIGAGNHFKIWEPAAGQAYTESVLQRAREKALTMPGRGGA
jgi:MraZ protein